MVGCYHNKRSRTTPYETVSASQTARAPRSLILVRHTPLTHPPYFFTPSRLPRELRPFVEDPPAAFDAHRFATQLAPVYRVPYIFSKNYHQPTKERESSAMATKLNTCVGIWSSIDTEGPGGAEKGVYSAPCVLELYVVLPIGTFVDLHISSGCRQTPIILVLHYWYLLLLYQALILIL